MNLPNGTRLLVLGIAFASPFFIAGCVQTRSHQHSEQTTAANNNDAHSRLAQELCGAWVLVGRPGDEAEPPLKGGRLKFRTGRHFVITQADLDTGLTILHDGGTYTLKGDRYEETTEYANESTADFIGKTLKFTVKVEGDTMTQYGIGNPYTEVWKRLK